MGRPFMTTAVCCVFCFLCVQCLSHHSKHHVAALSDVDVEQASAVAGVHRRGDSASHKACRRRRDVLEEQAFVKKLFQQFGDGDKMTFEGFEHLLKTVGLARLVSTNSLVDNASPPPLSNVANSKLDANGSTIQSNAMLANPNEGMTSRETKNQSDKCLNGRQLFTAFTDEHEDRLHPHSLERLCPGLLYQLTDVNTDCMTVSVDNADSHEIHIDHIEAVDHSKVWLYATLSIVLVSLCGLLGVAVIPVMQRVFYQQLLQFLVALAVGTLCGDALLHLLPHAMSEPHSHGHSEEASSEHDHNMKMWRGLMAALGLVFFFFTEKCLTLLGEWRKARQRRRKVPSRVRVMRDQDNMGNSTVGEKLCKHKYSSYPYCYGEITTEMSDDHHHQNAEYVQKHGHSHATAGEDEMKPMTTAANTVTTVPDSEHGTELNPSEAESYTVIIREHENKHHGHSHTHGHVHSPPDSLSSVAWMVVMGDGLHNFTDGMAIGAAFAANIAGGFSTAVAVFCHELPHELGDFAVLLKAGMSAKQAVFYNLLSSILSLVGMVLGIFLGESEVATMWVFSVAAGMFLYIALVDMIPELTTSHSKEGGSLCQCLLQCMGLLCGIGIMLLIAAYENDLKTVFTDK